MSKFGQNHGGKIKDFTWRLEHYRVDIVVSVLLFKYLQKKDRIGFHSVWLNTSDGAIDLCCGRECFGGRNERTIRLMAHALDYYVALYGLMSLPSYLSYCRWGNYCGMYLIIMKFPLVPNQRHKNNNHTHAQLCVIQMRLPLIARFMGPTWGPSGADRTQVGPMLAPWTLLSGSCIGTFVCRGLWPIGALTFKWK